MTFTYYSDHPDSFNYNSVELETFQDLKKALDVFHGLSPNTTAVILVQPYDDKLHVVTVDGRTVGYTDGPVS